MGDLDVVRDGTTVTLTLNRPDKRNALSDELVEALLNEVRVSYSDSTRLLVLRGEGKNLSAGFDFSDYQTQGEGELLRRFVRIEQLLQAVHHAPFLTVVCAHGRNFGAGADLFVACDRRIAAPGTTFRFPGLAFGLVLGTRRLAARTSASWASATLASLRTVDCDEASRAGLVTDVADVVDWPGLLDAARRDVETLRPATAADLHRLTTADTRDADLADLVRSAGAPGLVERIRDFREAQVNTAARSASTSGWGRG